MKKQKDKDFRKDVFDKKVNQLIEFGYSEELAKDQVLKDYNGVYLKKIIPSMCRKKIDIVDENGFYINRNNK